MKILLINGSPRNDGNTSVALKEFVNQLSSNGIESGMVWIDTKTVCEKRTVMNFIR